MVKLLSCPLSLSLANVAVSLVLHVDAAAKADNFNLVWSCNAASLPSVNKSIAIPTQVEANFTLALPTNSSIAAGTQALLFRMKVLALFVTFPLNLLVSLI
jgi:hypothetical protein